MKDCIILFDLDGTLIDSTEAIYESFCVAYSELGGEIPSRESIIQLIGHTLEDMFIKLGIKEEYATRYVARYKEHYRTVSIPKTVLLANAKNAITLAGSFAMLGVVTTKTGRFSRELLEHFGLLGFFETVIGREDVTHVKPHAEPILKALGSFETSRQILESGRVFMIGDTPLDIMSAQNAGVNDIGVLSGYANENILKTYTKNIANNALEAICLIRDRLGIKGV
ncbi:MAG: HAD family hydrolase [Wolinella sp.]